MQRNSARHRNIALKMATEAKRHLRYFGKERPRDRRPYLAIEAIQAWARGRRELSMKEVRRLSLDAHAAARACKTDTARFAARAAGHAVATWHVPMHAAGVPYYLAKLKAVKNNETT